MSYRKLFKKRVKKFKTGKWEEIWQEQKKVKVGGERIEEIGLYLSILGGPFT